MLTVTLGNQTTTLTRRDALQLSEGILLSLRNPYNLGEGGLNLEHSFLRVRSLEPAHQITPFRLLILKL